jgi:hypothetical protein
MDGFLFFVRLVGFGCLIRWLCFFVELVGFDWVVGFWRLVLLVSLLDISTLFYIIDLFSL